MRITIAKRGSPDYAAGRALARSRPGPFFSVEPEPRSDCFVVARGTRDRGSPPSACAGLTFPGRAPLVWERRLGRPVEAVIGARERRAVERCAIVAVDVVASTDVAAEDELVRALPMLAWCLGREYAICKPTARLRATFDRVGTRFVLLRPDRACTTSATRPDDNAPPVLGYTATTSLTTSGGSSSGHYCFDDIAIPVGRDAATADHG